MNDQISLLSNAITNFRLLFLKYRNSGGVISEREIEPLAIYFEQNDWRLVAYCRLRKENREFKLNRIHSLEEIGEFAPNQFSLQDYFEKKTRV